MEGLVGDIEGSIRNFYQDDGLEGLVEPHSSIP
jgi:hypothetical protein